MKTVHTNAAKNAANRQPAPITRLLHAAGAGDQVAWGRLLDLVFPEAGDARLKEQTVGTAMAVRMMRKILVDHARERLALTHCSDLAAVVVDAIDPADERQFEQLAEIDDALRCLAVQQPRQAHVFECRYFGGLSDNETALALGISSGTVTRDWDAARAWLAQAMTSLQRAH